MNEPFIFRVRDCYYIRASYPSPAEHRHFAAHLVFALERPFTALVDGKSVETVGIAIGSDVPHTIQSVDPALVVFIDELTPMRRWMRLFLPGWGSVGERYARRQMRPPPLLRLNGCSDCRQSALRRRTRGCWRPQPT